MSIFEGYYRDRLKSNFDPIAINGRYKLSVQASYYSSSFPKASFDHLDDYESFQVAVMEDDPNRPGAFIFVDISDVFTDLYNELYSYQESDNATIFGYVPRDVVEKIFYLFVYSE